MVACRQRAGHGGRPLRRRVCPVLGQSVGRGYGRLSVLRIAGCGRARGDVGRRRGPARCAGDDHVGARVTRRGAWRDAAPLLRARQAAAGTGVRPSSRARPSSAATRAATRAAGLGGLGVDAAVFLGRRQARRRTARVAGDRYAGREAGDGIGDAASRDRCGACRSAATSAARAAAPGSIRSAASSSPAGRSARRRGRSQGDHRVTARTTLARGHGTCQDLPSDWSAARVDPTSRSSSRGLRPDGHGTAVTKLRRSR